MLHHGILKLLLLYLLLSLCSTIYAQKIVLDAHDMPLPKVLTQINTKYHVPISFHSKTLQQCSISIQRQFDSPQLALEAIAQVCDCQVQQINQVFVFLPIPKKTTSSYFYRGQIIDISSKEALPYAFVHINNNSITTDEEGYFVYQSKDSIATIYISHIGYQSYQYQLTPSAQTHILSLHPIASNIPEVVVTPSDTISSIKTTDQKVGLAKLTLPSIPFLAGNNTNSLFAFMRLQAGVLAAGEQSKDFIIWGSYKGQSHILYDDITIFSPSTYNDLIGIVNPMMIQDIEILKGGYGVNKGERAGALVNIQSKSGSPTKNTLALELSNQILQGYSNIKLPQKGTFQFSVRQVIPDFFTTILHPEDQTKFQFTDIALKYHQPLPKAFDLKISLLGNYDYSELFRRPSVDSSFFDYVSERRLQFFGGGSLVLSKKWAKKGTSRLKVSSSGFGMNFDPNFLSESSDFSGLPNPFIFTNSFQRGISEFKASLIQEGTTTPHQQWTWGIDYLYNYTYLIHPVPSRDLVNLYQEGHLLQTYTQTHIHLTPLWTTLRLGVKAVIPLWETPQLFIQPRAAIRIRPHPHWNINIATGLYQQFISENSIIDKFYNHIYHWSISDGQQIPVLEVFQQVVNVNYQHKKIDFKLNGYYKYLSNMVTYLIDNPRPIIGVGRTYGLDFDIRTRIKKQQFWLTYSLSKTEECFCPNQTTKKFVPALHDQRHEIKLAGLLTHSNFQFSFNYILGSGLPNLRDNGPRKLYSRLDIALLYHLSLPKVKVDLGFSIINVMNTTNIRYRDFIIGPNLSNPARLATPFSPNIFVKVRF